MTQLPNQHTMLCATWKEAEGIQCNEAAASAWHHVICNMEGSWGVQCNEAAASALTRFVVEEAAGQWNVQETGPNMFLTQVSLCSTLKII